MPVHALEPKSTTHDTLNTKVVPIVFVPGVMGTRLELPGSWLGWDPDDPAEMADFLIFGRRDAMNKLDSSKQATPMRELQGTAMKDVVGNSRLREVAGITPRSSSVSQWEGEPTAAEVHANDETVVAFYQDRGWGEIVWGFYGQLLTELQLQLNERIKPESHPVFVCGYDWRKSNVESGVHLNTKIAEVLASIPHSSKVIVVTHSMGGLAARAAIQQGGDALMAGVVHCVIPADGAVVAYRRFHTGAVEDLDDPAVGWYFPWGPLNLIQGKDAVSYALTQSVLQGPLELLPHDSYPAPFLRLPDRRTNRDVPDLFGMYSSNTPPGILPEEGRITTGLKVGNVAWLPGLPKTLVPDIVTVRSSDVQRLRSALQRAGTVTRNLAGVAHAKTFLLYGSGQRTDVAFDWTRSTPHQTVRDMVVQQLSGDGTVPTASAQFKGAEQNTISSKSFPAKHAECYLNPDFREAAINAVKSLVARA